jgi:hypothetical protein
LGLSRNFGHRLYRACPMAASPAHLVRANGRLESAPKVSMRTLINGACVRRSGPKSGHPG